MTVAVSKALGAGLSTLVCASTGNTAASAAAYAARAGLDEPFGGERRDRALHRDGGGAVARHEVAYRRQPVARGRGLRRRSQVLDDAIACVIVVHEQWR